MTLNATKNISTASVIPLEQAQAIIFQIDLSHVIRRLVKVDGWVKCSAEEALIQYRRYIFLQKKYGQAYELPPSREVDAVWHAHILHTEKYWDFCQKIFGYYLHHHPHLVRAGSVEALKRDFLQTQKLCHEEFGCYFHQVSQRKWQKFWSGVFKAKSKFL